MKDLMKKVIMLLVVIIGIGGACFALDREGDLCRKNGCRNKLYYSIFSNGHALTCEAGHERKFEFHNDLQLDVLNNVMVCRVCKGKYYSAGKKVGEKCGIGGCTNKLEATPYELWGYKENQDKMSMLDAGHYLECADETHVRNNQNHCFDVGNSAGLGVRVCIDCKYECIADGGWKPVSTENCTYKCDQQAHLNHGVVPGPHIDKNNDGKCDRCKYNKDSGNSDNGLLPEQKPAPSKKPTTTPKPQEVPVTLKYNHVNGILVVTMEHSSFKPNKIESVEIRIGDLLVLYENNLNKNSDKILHINGNQLQLINGKVVYEVHPNTAVAQEIGDKNHKINILINNGSTVKPVSGMIKGCFNLNNIEEKPSSINNDKFETATKCPICNVSVEYKVTETMHVAVCTKDSNHILSIEDHKVDTNDQCTVCGRTVKTQYNMSFTDFNDSTHWAWKNIAYLNKLDIVRGSGNGDGTAILLPQDNITTEQLMALVARVLGLKNGEVINQDVYMPIDEDAVWSENEWKYLMVLLGDKAEEEMKILFAEGAIRATDDTIREKYSKQHITREKAAYLIGAFLEESSFADEIDTTFGDWNMVDSKYRTRLKNLAASNVLRGVPENGELLVNPKNPITRVEAFVLMDRLYALKYAK